MAKRNLTEIAEGAEEVDQGEVSTIILGMLESSGFRKCSTMLMNQLFSRRLCHCHCLCIRLYLCICVPYSFLNSYYHKLSENVWVWGSVASRSGDVTIAGRTDEQTIRKDRANSAIRQWKAEMSNSCKQKYAFARCPTSYANSFRLFKHFLSTGVNS